MPHSSRGRKRKTAEVERAFEDEEIQRQVDDTAVSDEGAGEQDEQGGESEADGEDEEAVVSGEEDDEIAEEKDDEIAEEEYEEVEEGEEASWSGEDDGEELAGVDGGSATMLFHLRTTEQDRQPRPFPIDQPVYKSVIEFARSANNRRVIFGVMLTAKDGCLPPVIKLATNALRKLFTKKGTEIGLYSPAITSKADKAPHARTSTQKPIPRPDETKTEGDSAAASSVAAPVSAVASTQEHKQTAEPASAQVRPDSSGTLPSQQPAPLPAGIDETSATPRAMSADDMRLISELLARLPHPAPPGNVLAAQFTSMMDSIPASSSLSASAATPSSSTAGGVLAFAGRDSFAAHHISTLSVDLSDSIRRVGSALNPEAAREELQSLVLLLRDQAGSFAPVFGLFAAKVLGDDRPDLAHLLLEQLREQNSEVVQTHTELRSEYNYMLLHLAGAMSIKAMSSQLSAIGDTVAKESSATRQQLLSIVEESSATRQQLSTVLSMLTTLTQLQQQQQHLVPPPPVAPAELTPLPPTPPPRNEISDSGVGPSEVVEDTAAPVERDDSAAPTVRACLVEVRRDSDSDSRLVEQMAGVAAGVVQDARDRHPHMLLAASSPVDAQAAYSMHQHIV